MSVVESEPELIRIKLEFKVFWLARQLQLNKSQITHFFMQLRLRNLFHRALFAASRTFCVADMPHVTATPRHPSIQLGDSLHFIEVILDESFCSTVSKINSMRVSDAIVCPILVLLFCFHIFHKYSYEFEVGSIGTCTCVRACKRTLQSCVL
jgi:hypothetical protein